MFVRLTCERVTVKSHKHLPVAGVRAAHRHGAPPRWVGGGQKATSSDRESTMLAAPRSVA
jgi:hypothetical protein